MMRRVLSITKLLGQLHNAGNTTTVSWYGELTTSVGLLTPLRKYAGQVLRQRASTLKWMVHDTVLHTAPMGITLTQAKKETARWGRMVESAVGAHLIHGSATKVTRSTTGLTAIVKWTWS